MSTVAHRGSHLTEGQVKNVLPSPVIDLLERILRSQEEKKLMAQISTAEKEVGKTELRFREFQSEHHTVVVDFGGRFDYSEIPGPEDLLSPEDLKAHNTLFESWQEAERRLTELGRGIPAARGKQGLVKGVLARLLLN